jgi:hypothetical protein
VKINVNKSKRFNSGTEISFMADSLHERLFSVHIILLHGVLSGIYSKGRIRAGTGKEGSPIFDIICAE